MQIKQILLFLLLPFFGISQIPYEITIIKGGETDLQTLKDGNVATGWFPGWNSNDYPVKALIEFDDEYYLEKVRYYDWVGKPKLTISEINSTGTVQLAEIELGGYGVWSERQISSNNKVRYLEISISDIQGDRPITELEFYGSKTNNPDPPIVPIGKLYGDALKIAVNGFHWVPQELNPTKNLRMFQMLQWTWTQNGISVEPTFQADGNYDSYLKSAKDKGQTIIFCQNKIPDWFSDKSVPDWHWQRLGLPNCTSDVPLCYIDVAKYAWQLSARYGSETYPNYMLNVNTIPRWNGDVVNEPKSGLNLIKYIEIENEPDRPWNPAHLKYTPEEYAAFLSAIYDGHQNSMGDLVGVKNADKKLKVVLNLSTINISYLNDMKVWFEQNRSDKKFCVDVIQVHYYCNSANQPGSINVDLTGKGVSPEDNNLEYKLKEFNMWCKQNVPNAETWFGEFGYDTEPPTTFLSQYPQLYGNHTAEELQGQWLLRTYLYCLSSNIDKSFMFNLCDENSAKMGYCFGSCGLLTSESDGYKKKQSWKDVDWLVRELNGWKFYKDRSVDGVKIFEFRSKIAMSKFFYWSPTSNDSTCNFSIGTHNLTATEKIQTITLSRFLSFIKAESIQETNKK